MRLAPILKSLARAGLGAALLLGVAAAAAAAADSGPRSELLKVRVGGDRLQTRVVVELNHEARARLVAADPRAAARRFVFALPRVAIAGDMAGPGEGLVRGWSVDQVGSGARLSLDLSAGAVVRRRFALPPGDGGGAYRYVFDLALADGAAPADAGASGASSASRPVPILAGLLRGSVLHDAARRPPAKVIVIDPGHGGRDSGALGADSREKDDTLAAARALAEILKADGRYKVVMTRETDAYIPLERRVQIARRANADLFISLHADSIGVVGAATRGASVYTLSDRGADRTAKGLFGRSDWFMNVALPGRDSATKRILLDLTQRQTVNRSSTFAELLIDRLSGVAPLLARSHRDANLMVLLAPDVPAVLLEMGFITNPEDERALASPDRRRQMMRAVAEAIGAYFDEESKLGEV